MRIHLYRGKPLRKEDYILNENMQYGVGYFKDGFVYGSLIVNHDKYFICVGVAGVMINSLINNATATLIEVIPETVGEYTNLTDKNGKKIFEGDIVAYCTSTNRATNKEFHEVVFETRGESGYFGIKISNIETWGFCMEMPAKLMGIIGNIHDNPELLDATK